MFGTYFVSGNLDLASEIVYSEQGNSLARHNVWLFFRLDAMKGFINGRK